MKERSISVFFISKMEDIAWLSGFTGSTAYIVITDEEQLFITDGRYKEQSRLEIGDGWKTTIVRRYGEEFNKVAKTYKDITLQPSTPAYLWDLFAKAKAKVSVDTADSVQELRMVKTPEELEILRGEYNLAGGAFLQALERWQYGQTERHWAAELEYQMKLKGARGASFDTIVASGVRGALPHGVASDKVILNGEAVTIDFGSLTRYTSDYTRVVYNGSDRDILKVINIVREALESAMHAVKSGVYTSTLDKVARDHIEKSGFGEYFNHGLGHGVGMEVHELPSINASSDIVLKPSMVFTIEPGIYIPDKFGVRLEETVIVTESSCELLSSVLDRYIYNVN
jgi:Xaa-Pro aminopeptidase